MGVNVLLNFIKAQTLFRGDGQHFPGDRRHNLTGLWALAKRTAVFGRIDVFPNDFFLRSHFKDSAVGTGTNERVAVGEALSPGNEGGEEVALIRRGVTPQGFVGAVAWAWFQVVVSKRVDGQRQLVHRRM